ncbi:MAG: phosphoribosylglycinamide formyltransferase [Candidatus Omnitrophica bacterium]|nr:phosphoribosylglycinamide formyltransferase [Candidatus Omnitrophota bacterium]
MKHSKTLPAIAILASGNGSNAENIIRAVEAKKLRARIAFVFSNKRTAKVLDRARCLGVPYVSFEVKDFKSRAEYERALLLFLKKERVDFIILAGYMLLLGNPFTRKYKNRIVNIRPSLLPAFKGTHAIRDAHEYGVRVSGVTVHYVVPELDSGPIILQQAVTLRPGESLHSFEKRIHQAEYELYPEALKKVLGQK